MNAKEIVALLAMRHAKDVFVPECKDGPTHYSSHRRLDAWAMATSWAHPAYDGYEVKVSRGDWLRDQKVEDYLPMCNRLWVVALKGIVQVAELPPGVGLLEVASTGTRLMTRTKAVYREIPPPHDVLRYVLMCRSRIRSEYAEASTREERAAHWQRWSESENWYKELGYQVSRKLREETVKRAGDAEARAKAAEARADQLAEAADILKRLGLSAGMAWNLEHRAKEVLDVAGPLRRALHDTANELDRLAAISANDKETP